VTKTAYLLLIVGAVILVGVAVPLTVRLFESAFAPEQADTGQKPTSGSTDAAIGADATTGGPAARGKGAAKGTAANAGGRAAGASAADGTGGTSGTNVTAAGGAMKTPGENGAIRKYGPRRPGKQPEGPTGRLDPARLSFPPEESTLRKTTVEAAGTPFQPDCQDCGRRFDFSGRGAGFDVLVAPGELVFCVRRPDEVKLQGKEAPTLEKETTVDCSKVPREVCLSMRLVGMSQDVRVVGPEKGVGVNSVLAGNDPRQWISDISSYSRVRYENLYPGIDFSCYGDQNRFEFVFVVRPGGDPSAIRMSYTGAKSVTTDGRGNLVLEFDGGRLTQGPPIIYQIVSGTARVIEGVHVVEKNEVSLSVRDYDRGKPLYIGPVMDSLSYLGGAGEDIAYAVTVDNAGCAYVLGESTSASFGGRARSKFAQSRGVFVTKYRLADSEHLFTTFLTGSADDRGFGIAVNRAGNVFLCGETLSPDFPASDPLQAQGQAQSWDGFVTRLSANGAEAEFTYRFAGNRDDRVYGIAVDNVGHVYVAGETASTDFPYTHILRPGHTLGSWDGFIAKLDASGSFLHFASCLGGSGDDSIYSLSVDQKHCLYVSGQTASPDFPQVGAAPVPPQGGLDAFVAKVAPAGNALLFSSRLGGSGDDRALGVFADGSGNAFVAGETTSRDLVLTNALQRFHGGGEWDAFVARYDGAGSMMQGTYLGGSGDDRAFSVAADSYGGATVVGSTTSSNFPVTRALQVTFAGGQSDGFVAQLNPAGSVLLYSGFVGGNRDEALYAATVDARRSAHFAGRTDSTNVPVIHALQATYRGETDAIVGRIPSQSRTEPNLRLVAGGGQPHGPKHDFYMGKYEVTNDEFARFLNDAQANTNNARGSHLWFDPLGNVWFNPAMMRDRHEVFGISASRIMYRSDYPLGTRYFVTDARPVVGGSYSNHAVSGVSWYGAIKFCNWLTVEAGRGEDSQCYSEGTNAWDWRPITASGTNWVHGIFTPAERELWLGYKGFRLPMDNSEGRTTSPNPYNEFLKAAAWNGVTNMPFGFGRERNESGDASFLNDGLIEHDTVPVGSFDGRALAGAVTRTNENVYGIHDLSGSMDEWMSDPGATNVPGNRASYGGSWLHALPKLNERSYVPPHFTDRFRGFRIVTTEPAEIFHVVRIPYAICLKGCGVEAEPGAPKTAEEEDEEARKAKAKAKAKAAAEAEAAKEDEDKKPKTLDVTRRGLRPGGLVYSKLNPPDAECPNED
jgi:formylglycine-generating enzyme required for sulfatase activity